MGRRSRRVYSLGDPVRIRVTRTDMEQKLLDYELIEVGRDDKKGKRDE